MTQPNKSNFCGGNYADWLEVNLLPECNGKCKWCVEAQGYHPTQRVSWDKLLGRILETGKKHVMLLGGEPTLYPDLGKLIKALVAAERTVSLTTNGSKLGPHFIETKLKGLTSINISIHEYRLAYNNKITGILLLEEELKLVTQSLKQNNISVRFNCNLISGYIDTRKQIEKYCAWAKLMGADDVRFAELKGNSFSFVNLYTIMGGKSNIYGLTEDPYTKGCIQSGRQIHDMKVTFRQMCGLQTSARPTPKNPQSILKQVLYYDGKLYDGWQTEQDPVATILWQLKHEMISVEEAKDQIDKYTVRKIHAETQEVRHSSGNGCCY